MRPRVGVVIPTYNRRHVVGAAIDSVLAQTRPPDRVVVIDDGGSDDTMSLLETFGDRIIARRISNGGVSAARNAGTDIVDCDWIAFLDDDDIWSPTRLESFHRDIAAASPDVVAHIGNLVFSGPGYRHDLFGMKGLTAPAGRAAKVDDALQLVISGMSLEVAVVRRDAFIASGRFDTSMRMYEDTVFFWKLAQQGPFLVTGDVLSEARRVEGSALTSAHVARPIEGETLYAQQLERLLQDPLNAQQRRMVAGKLSGALLGLALMTAPSDRTAARHLLWRAARAHPSALRGWTKSLLALTPARSLAAPDRTAANLRH